MWMGTTASGRYSLTGGSTAREGAGQPAGRRPRASDPSPPPSARHLEHLLTVAVDRPGTSATASTTTGLLGLAGLTSLGAGAIHAAAIGVHSEHRSAVVAFTAVAALQLAWGVLALVRGTRLVAVLGLLIGTGVLAGWALAKVSGISFIAGLDEAEPLQTADGLAAGLALTSVLALGAALWTWRSARPGLRAPLPLMAVGVTALTVFGMVTAGSHAHAAGDGHGSVAAGHHADGAGAADHVQDASAATVPYDPTKPIDLSGVEGVTPEQQAAAENVIAVTLHGLPQWADPTYAEANGFHSIGDGFTGIEHLMNEANMDDDVILDPDVPESLVYDTSGGGRRLVAAMYMLKRGTPLEQAPDLGGNLMQWHTHDNLCYNAEGKVRGITDASGACRAGLVKPVETPMIHVWLEPHPCGPFAALEGIAGGRIPDGEEVLCDHAHGD
ncbi:hypothetical protein SAMN05660748_0162 [Blastococcus aggregatus]|uniref:Uncharacterized protein n=2 Tax=Blastococcus aggregatus TaxID=38502 RepID=A0A285UWN4_9ACTN|nr:hypothetical protein SAMN05660748_0162 [Blastococcus aggregatus]